jgi:hypothetical protein
MGDVLLPPFWNIIGALMPSAAIRRVLFENDDIHYTYHGAGSCLVFSCDGRLFMATAKHVLVNSKSDVNDIFIMGSDTSSRCLPFVAALNWKSMMGNSFAISDADDIIVFVAGDTSTFDSRIDFATINENNIEKDFENIEYCCIGCPNISNFVDYDNGKILSCKKYVIGKIQEQDECVVTLSTELTSDEDAYNGMSGGACFCYHSDSPSNIKFAGILIQGCPKHGILRFVKARIVTALAEERRLRILNGKLELVE